MPSDRRTFLRHAAAVGILGPAVAAWACGDRPPTGRGTASETGPGDAVPMARPTLVAGKGDAVHVLSPAGDPPVAYLSRGEMRLYLDGAYRDWAEHRLAAYVSVTTGLWRIPRPEDDPRVPIVPGDELREYEVVDLVQWDPAMTPAEGDVRLRLGARRPVRVDLACVAMASADAWLTAPSLLVSRRDGPAGEGGREDFVEVGTGTLHADAGCKTAGDAVRLLAWVSRGP